MECAGFFILLLVIFAIGVIKAIVDNVDEKKRLAEMNPVEREAYVLAQQHGEINPAMVCPHCQHRGKVRTKLIDRKKGVSGGKATAAILTGGVSMLATGLSRHERLTHAYCGNCESSWEF
jgi:hypothetical protein